MENRTLEEIIKRRALDKKQEIKHGMWKNHENAIFWTEDDDSFGQRTDDSTFVK